MALTPRGKKLLDKIKADLAVAGGGSAKYPTPSDYDNKLFEVYLVMRVVSAAICSGYSINFVRENDDKPAHAVRFRGAPLPIFHNGGSIRPYTYIQLTSHQGAVLRVYLGVQVAGDSGVNHECDVLVITEAKAKAALSLKRDPGPGSPVIHIEAKCYTSPVGMGTGREVYGIAADLCAQRSILACPQMDVKVDTFLNGVKRATMSPASAVLPALPGHGYILRLIKSDLPP